jgi:hypothetical protein
MEKPMPKSKPIDDSDSTLVDDRLAYDILETAKISNSSRSEIYKSLKLGVLSGKKHGRRTVILREDLSNYLRNLPDYKSQTELLPPKKSPGGL